jgi:hypothetical protein
MPRGKQKKQERQIQQGRNGFSPTDIETQLQNLPHLTAKEDIGNRARIIGSFVKNLSTEKPTRSSIKEKSSRRHLWSQNLLHMITKFQPMATIALATLLPTPVVAENSEHYLTSTDSVVKFLLTLFHYDHSHSIFPLVSHPLAAECDLHPSTSHSMHNLTGMGILCSDEPHYSTTYISGKSDNTTALDIFYECIKDVFEQTIGATSCNPSPLDDVFSTQILILFAVMSALCITLLISACCCKLRADRDEAKQPLLEKDLEAANNSQNVGCGIQ